MYFQNTVVDNGVKKQSNYKKQKDWYYKGWINVDSIK